MEPRVYGYIRVSSRDQNEDRQIDAMQGEQVPPDKIFMDKLSGKDFNRPAYRKMMRRLKRGDLLLVKSIDRLGRNYDEILEQWRIITKEKGADIRILDMPLLDTRRDKDLLGTLISDLVLQLLSFVAQSERELIRQRQKEGIAAAKLRGVKFGRPALEVPEHFYELREVWRAGGISSRAAGKALGISHQTFIRWAGKCGNKIQKTGISRQKW